MWQLIAQLKDPKYFLALLFVLIFLSTLVVSLFECQQPTWPNHPLVLENTNSPGIPIIPSLTSVKSRSITVKSGDTWSSIFQSLQLNFNLLSSFLTLPEVRKYLTPLKINQHFSFIFDHGVLQSIKATIDVEHMLIIHSKNGILSTDIINIPVITQLAYIQGTIKNSFIHAAHRAGLSNAQAFQIANIFQSKINFSTALKAGDHFETLYQSKSVDGKILKQKSLAVVKFYTNNHVYTAIRFQNKAGKTAYYDEKGQGVQPALKRIPLHYKRISSPFSMHRFHPILHIYRPHLGVDFAAHSGTPVKSVGEGKIIQMIHHAEAGNMIKIKYSKHYVSVYAHLSKFAKNLHKNDMVTQGEVIGYVGSTGLSTGPHLHYGVYIDGHPKNPMTIQLLGINPISSNKRKLFLDHVKLMLSLINLYHMKQTGFQVSNE